MQFDSDEIAVIYIGLSHYRTIAEQEINKLPLSHPDRNYAVDTYKEINALMRKIKSGVPHQVAAWLNSLVK